MLMTEKPHDGVSVDLPVVTYPKLMRAANREDAMLVSIFHDGKAFFRDEQTNPTELSVRIRASLSSARERRIYIRPDARVYYRTVDAVLDAIHSAGIESVSFLVEQRGNYQLPHHEQFCRSLYSRQSTTPSIGRKTNTTAQRPTSVKLCGP
jgi:biopolymer transport protein ExbD